MPTVPSGDVQKFVAAGAPYTPSVSFNPDKKHIFKTEATNLGLLEGDCSTDGVNVTVPAGTSFIQDGIICLLTAPFSLPIQAVAYPKRVVADLDNEIPGTPVTISIMADPVPLGLVILATLTTDDNTIVSGQKISIRYLSDRITVLEGSMGAQATVMAGDGEPGALSAVEGTLYWDRVGNLLYVNRDGNTDWGAVGAVTIASGPPSGPGDEGNFYWDETNDELYINTDGGTTWKNIGGPHAATHAAGGSDPIKLDDLDTPDDNTDLDATTGHHGLLPKLSGDINDVFRGDGTFGQVPVELQWEIAGEVALSANAKLTRYRARTLITLGSFDVNVVTAGVGGDTVILFKVRDASEAQEATVAIVTLPAGTRLSTPVLAAVSLDVDDEIWPELQTIASGEPPVSMTMNARSAVS